MTPTQPHHPRLPGRWSELIRRATRDAIQEAAEQRFAPTVDENEAESRLLARLSRYVAKRLHSGAAMNRDILHAVARKGANQVLRELDRPHRTTQSEQALASAHASISDTTTRDLLPRVFSHLLGDLESTERRILAMSYLHGMSYRQIGQELGLSAPAVRRKAQRALSTLAQSLREAAANDEKLRAALDLDE